MKKNPVLKDKNFFKIKLKTPQIKNLRIVLNSLQV